MTAINTAPYDAILLVSFGGPEGMDDIMPFLDNVLRGKNVPHERKLEVAHHYEQFGGVSPINDQNRALIDAIKADLKEHNIDLPFYWGNRNWHPLLPDTMQQMADDGIQHALVILTSAYSSYSGCRQYREDIERAQAHVGEKAPQVSILRKFYNHPGFINANVDHIRQALAQIPAEQHANTHIAFCAHSIPNAMARNCMYETQLTETSNIISEMVQIKNWNLVYQSRSGPPTQPWLEPDINDHLHALHAQGVTHVVVAPIGFISDHLEVKYDLDTEAIETAQELGMTLVRAATAGTHPEFVAMFRDLILERIDNTRERATLGKYSASPDVCAPNCCLSGHATVAIPTQTINQQ